MNRWFTKLAMVLLPSFAVSLAPVNAAYYPTDPCCPEPYYSQYDACDPCMDFCNGFFVGADFIWWKPCIDDLDYAIQYDVPAIDSPFIGITLNGRYHQIDPNWEPGVRAFAGIEDIWCGWDLIGSYTWIHVKERDHATNNGVGGSLFSTQFNPALLLTTTFEALTSRYRLQYQTFDVLLATECCLCNCHFFKPFFGFTGVFLDQKIDTEGEEEGVPGILFADLRWKNDYWGLGIKVGSEYRYEFCDGFSLFAAGSIAIVAGDSDTRRRERRSLNTDPGILNTHNDECVFLNGYHVQSGIVYEDCWCDWDFAFRLGYEFVKWTNVPNLRRFSSTISVQSGISTSPTTTTLGFHGLFAGFSVGF